jgi:adenine/guanine phosphoribosyltransferase-like PRPP-binding protein
MRNETTTNSLEVLKDNAKSRLGREFPALTYDRLVMVDPKQTRLGIDDVSALTNTSLEENIAFLMLACKGEMFLYDAATFTKALSEKLDRLIDVSGRSKTVLIFPGNGAQTVKGLLPKGILDGTTVIDVPTVRKVSAQKTVEGVTITNATQGRKIIADVKPQTIVVVDDVIASGATLSTLQEAFPGRKIEWNAAALLSLSPIQRRKFVNGTKSGIEGYENIVSPIVYQGTSGIPAVNSISTLIGSSEKSEAVRTRYVEDFVVDQALFNEALKELREKINEK